MRELIDLPVEPVAAEKAHLHLWTPPEMLEDGLRLVRAWGFQYQASLVRTKPPAESGSYWRQAHDVLLLGVRGDMEFRDRSLLSWMDPRTSEAAESLREIRSVDRAGQPGTLPGTVWQQGNEGVDGADAVRLRGAVWPQSLPRQHDRNQLRRWKRIIDGQLLPHSPWRG